MATVERGGLMLPHPGTPRFLTLILSAAKQPLLAHSPHHRRHRQPFAFSVVQRVSAESPQTLLPTPKIDPLPVTPYLPLLTLYLPKRIERAENLNSLLGLLIPRIDAEFRAQPFALIPSFLFPFATATFARLLALSSLRSTVRPSFPQSAAILTGEAASRDELENLRYRSAPSATRLELRPSIERASERASGNERNGYHRGD